jgi:hypothetical protein
MKKPSQKLVKFLLKKEVKKWADENKGFIEDVQNLCHEMVMFEMKYGTKVLYSFEKPLKKEGRGIGKDFTNLQDIINAKDN